MKKETQPEKSVFLESVGLLTMLAFGAFVIGAAFNIGAYVVVLFTS